MDKSCKASVESSSTSSLNLSKLSHKISKATPQVKKPCFDAPLNQNHPSFNHPQNRLQSEAPPVQPQQQQPPVYNINKNDFRDVVQKLTGSPAHERSSNPPPIQLPKHQSSRLQRIRPPPLARVNNHPPPQQLLNNANLNNFNLNSGLAGRPIAPLSPLPPLPTVHAAAESPVSAYMRYIQNTIPTADSYQGFSPYGPMVSSCWDNFTAQQQGTMPVSPSSAILQPHPQFQVPLSSPLALGCSNSPRSSLGVFSSPNLTFPPSTGQLGFPQSPTVPASSPRWIGD